MKYELPIAITLLAVGCLLWILHDEGNSAQSAAGVPTPIDAINSSPATRFDSNIADKKSAWQPPTTATFVTAGHDAASSSTAIHLASHSQDIVWEPPNAERRRNNGSRVVAHKSPLTMNRAAQMLADVAASFRDGRSSTGSLEIESQLFGRKHRIKARFWQAGQGSEKSRIEMIPQIGNPIKVTQVCDGRTLYRLLQRGEKSQLTFMRLDQLANEDAGLIQATLPATWVGSGSIDKLFLHLAEAFDFASPQSVGAEGNRVELTGTWNTAFLVKLMINRIDHRELTPKVKWEKLPPQIPHAVKVTLSNQGDDVWLPETVTFIKFQTNESKNRIKTSMAIRFLDIQQTQLGSELFTLQANDVPAVNETGIYNERIDLLAGSNRVAAQPATDVR